jgi:hypothetical protein
VKVLSEGVDAQQLLSAGPTALRNMCTDRPRLNVIGLNNVILNMAIDKLQ